MCMLRFCSHIEFFSQFLHGFSSAAHLKIMRPFICVERLPFERNKNCLLYWSVGWATVGAHCCIVSTQLHFYAIYLSLPPQTSGENGQKRENKMYISARFRPKQLARNKIARHDPCNKWLCRLELCYEHRKWYRNKNTIPTTKLNRYWNLRLDVGRNWMKSSCRNQLINFQSAGSIHTRAHNISTKGNRTRSAREKWNWTIKKSRCSATHIQFD